jgi:hypothetical protein
MADFKILNSVSNLLQVASPTIFDIDLNWPRPWFAPHRLENQYQNTIELKFKFFPLKTVKLGVGFLILLVHCSPNFLSRDTPNQNQKFGDIPISFQQFEKEIFDSLEPKLVFGPQLENFVKIIGFLGRMIRKTWRNTPKMSKNSWFSILVWAVSRRLATPG